MQLPETSLEFVGSLNLPIEKDDRPSSRLSNSAAIQSGKRGTLFEDLKMIRHGSIILKEEDPVNESLSLGLDETPESSKLHLGIQKSISNEQAAPADSLEAQKVKTHSVV